MIILNYYIKIDYFVNTHLSRRYISKFKLDMLINSMGVS